MIYKECDRHSETVAGPFGGGGQLTRRQLIKTDADLCDKGRLFGHMTLAPDSSIGYHVHNGDSELYYILNGTGVYNDNGTEVPVEAGDLTIVKAGEGHALKNTGETPMDFIALIVYA